jgi:cellulose synthase/poly-beta-1,6-N-acetylglucosamine synthase-like glycosyltransferase
MKVSVIVPSYRRVKDLARCLTALRQQIRPADEVVVVVRDTDTETWTFLESFEVGSLPLKTAKVTVTGVIAAMNVGMATAQEDILAFTDDDAAPHADWLQRIEAHFLDNDQVGGVGGRDIIQRSEPWFRGEREVVGRLQWYGRLIGEHHRGIGQAREVDILKGVNMSFRRAAIADLRFDDRLLGTGAQVHFEVAFCLALKRKGWTLIYDPKILVDHYVAQRFDEDQRDRFNSVAFANAVHNETLALLEHFSGVQQIAFWIWALILGSRQSFGIAQWLRMLPSEGKLAGYKWWASMQGRWQGLKTWRRSQHYSTLTANALSRNSK